MMYVSLDITGAMNIISDAALGALLNLQPLDIPIATTAMGVAHGLTRLGLWENQWMRQAQNVEKDITRTEISSCNAF